MTRETELLPCKCGTLFPPDTIEDRLGWAFTYCQSCGYETDWYDCVTAAITAWNTRAK